jgi:hypothetical protein
MRLSLLSQAEPNDPTSYDSLDKPDTDRVPVLTGNCFHALEPPPCPVGAVASRSSLRFLFSLLESTAVFRDLSSLEDQVAAKSKSKSRKTTASRAKVKTLSVKKGSADRVKGGSIPGPEELK